MFSSTMRVKGPNIGCVLVASLCRPRVAHPGKPRGDVMHLGQAPNNPFQEQGTRTDPGEPLVLCQSYSIVPRANRGRPGLANRTHPHNLRDTEHSLHA